MFFRLLYLVPKNWLSHLVGKAARTRFPFRLHTVLRDAFIRFYRIDTGEAELPLERYPTLGEFFIRRLKPDARSLSSDPLVSPVDGTLTQGGSFDPAKPMLKQIKGIDYALRDLVGPDWDLSGYLSGGFLTIYLAPYNYHRIHAPIGGRVTQCGHIPGALWPVNTWSVSHIPGLFVANERILVELEGEGGKALVVMVGATNVGRITLDFHAGMIGNARPAPIKPSRWSPPQPLFLEKGQGLGCFELGSTVILILSEGLARRIRPELVGIARPGEGGIPVRMGQSLGA
jgi:phosphatidylserine decarboxylase